MPLYDFSCADGHRFERIVPLAQFGDQQLCECGAEAGRLVCAPAIRSDYLAGPLMGADGRLHDSKSSYERSLTPDGNASGERFHILNSDEPSPVFKPVRSTEAERVEVAKKALHDVTTGNVPPINLIPKEIPA